MKYINQFIFILVASFSMTVVSTFAESTSAENSELYIISPKDGETVKSPFVVKFGLRGMGVAPAGVDKPNTGHHHLLINVKKLPDLKSPVPADAQHKHFGNGQTETKVELKPGKHSLQLLLGDKSHVPHNKPLISKKITVIVK